MAQTPVVWRKSPLLQNFALQATPERDK